MDDDNKCTLCKAQMAVKVTHGETVRHYNTGNRAFAEVADGSTVTLLADAELNQSIFRNADDSRADKSVTLLMNGKKLCRDLYETALGISSGKLTISDEAVISTNVSNPSLYAVAAVVVNGGTLEFKARATITGGLLVTDYDDDGKKIPGTLEGGLPKDTIITRNGTGNAIGGTYYSVSVKGSSKYESVLDLLNEGYAYAVYNADGTTGNIVDGSVESIQEDVIVVEHSTHSFDKSAGKCACGYECPHVKYTDGNCDVCGYECLHRDVNEETARCNICNMNIAAKVVLGDTTTYYTNAGDAITKASDGSTVTLLASASLPDGVHVTNTTGITLDLNGKSLSGQALNVGNMDIRGNDIPGKLTVRDSGNGNGQIGLEVKNGGTLVFDPGNNKTKITQLTVYGGNVKLYGGRILGSDKTNFRLENKVKMTDLLPVGYAYHLYSSEASYAPVSYSNAAKNDMTAWTSGYDLVTEQCDHTKLTSGFNEGECLYCKGILQATVTKDGKITGQPTAQDAVNEANGGTVKLLANAGSIDISSALKLDCNGHAITKLTVSNGVTLASLLPDGYAFRQGDNWLNDSDLSGETLDNVTTAEAPVKSVTAKESKVTSTYGEQVTLEATADTTNGESSFKWYKVDNGIETDLTSDGSYTKGAESCTLPADLAAGEYTYRLTYTKDGYSKSCDFTVKVEAKDLTDVMVGTIADQTYDGNAKIPEVTVKNGETTLIAGQDYTVAYTANTKAGEATATITGKGNYTGQVVKKFTIKQKALSANEITVASGGTYDGKAKKPEVTVMDGDKTLTAGTDYTLSYADNTNAGVNTAKVTVTGKGNYTGTVEKNFSIAKAVTIADQTNEYIFYKLAKTYTFNPPALPDDCGQVSYRLDSVDIPGFYDEFSDPKASIDPETGVLTLPIESAVIPAMGGGDLGMVTIIAETENYEDITLTIIVSGKHKIMITEGAPTLSSAVLAYGEKLNTITLSGSMKDGDKEIEGTFAWENGEYEPDQLGECEAHWVFTPDVQKHAEYLTAVGRVRITVKEAKLTGVSVNQTGTLEYTGELQGVAVQTAATAVNNQEVTFTYSDAENGTYGAAIPKFTDAGKHTVYYKAEADKHEDFYGSFLVTIEPASVTTTDKPTQNTVYAGTEVSKVTFKESKVTVEFNGKQKELEGTWSLVPSTEGEKFRQAGDVSCTATFTPRDKNFAPITGIQVTVKVTNKPSGGGALPTTEVVTVDKVTTSPAEVKNEIKTDADGNKETISKVTVSVENQKEIIKQAKGNKSGEIVIKISDKEIKDGTKFEIALDKDFVDFIVKDTDAKLTIKTPEGDKTFTQEELKKLSESAAADGTITVDPTASEPTDTTKAEKIAKAKSLIEKLNLVARSSKTAKKNVKVVSKNDKACLNAIEELKDLGFTVKYRFYRSTKKSAGYKSTVTKKTASYINTSGKKGTKYFYKVQVRVYDEKGKLVAKTELKQCRYASRTWGK